MWFATQTAFIDGKHFASKICFHPDASPDTTRFQRGTCLASHREAPGNRVETFMDGRIEIHIDWFQTKEQAIQFCNGSLTYVIYQRTNKNGLPDFIRWEAVPTHDDILPWRGIYKREKV